MNTYMWVGLGETTAAVADLVVKRFNDVIDRRISLAHDAHPNNT
jgi:hypothetical protein